MHLTPVGPMLRIFADDLGLQPLAMEIILQDFDAIPDQGLRHYLGSCENA